ncbi:hypothetical protein DICPUDRAFT_159833 [Dictyostelium purpureum]|uniref:Ribosome biogenesis protein SLX9 n=1 Tax=Dictyostelium purpureum TaxID=5786 RepID=F1A531_DICPU|nr:uncharacterized protein DICPUDRAFT_159833 [Dictyostelium purpureum]EGC28698.1 hypothetical protein DICPUDRAFT_159833 [Dictyostelium purpureum]|eukprot:XP_003294774.1 hypothetical protein DICPUDRAFT_159833 [Dictyostelium purpureum]
MPKEVKSKSLHIKSSARKEDEFAKAEKTSFVSVPNFKLDTSIINEAFKSLNKNIIPSGNLDYSKNENIDHSTTTTTDTADRRPQLQSKKEKRKQKKEAFLSKFNPSSTLNLKNNKNSNNNDNEEEDDEENENMGLSGVMSSINLLKDSMKLQPKTKGPKLTNEKRKKISQKELSQYKNVLAHPQFQSNPFATLQEHLANSVALQNQKIKQEEDFKKQNQPRKNKNKMMN